MRHGSVAANREHYSELARQVREVARLARFRLPENSYSALLPAALCCPFERGPRRRGRDHADEA
jgi:hypothetical protein